MECQACRDSKVEVTWSHFSASHKQMGFVVGVFQSYIAIMLENRYGSREWQMGFISISDKTVPIMRWGTVGLKKLFIYYYSLYS